MSEDVAARFLNRLRASRVRADFDKMFDVLECALAAEAGRADAGLLRVFRIRPVATGLRGRRGGLRGLKQQRDYQEGCGAEEGDAERAGSCRVEEVTSRLH